MLSWARNLRPKNSINTFSSLKVSQHFVGVPTAPKGEVAPLWKPTSSLIAKKHTDTVQVKPIVQRGRPALAGRRRHP